MADETAGTITLTCVALVGEGGKVFPIANGRQVEIEVPTATEQDRTGEELQRVTDQRTTQVLVIATAQQRYDFS